MENALYTTKTPTNQALTLRPWGNRITLPILLPVLLVTLLVLSACGGGGGGSKNNVTQNPASNCTTNPFGTACTSEADKVRRDAIIKRCILGGNAGTTATPECVTARREVPCIANPFTAECASSTSTFATYVETARTERLSFCRMATNTATDFCGTAVDNICTGDIFDRVCTSNLEKQRDFCRMGDNLTSNPNCAAVAAPVCALGPLFDALCTPDTVRQRMYCRTGTNAADVANCEAVVTGICTDNPFDGICAGMFLVNDDGRAEFCGRGNNSVTYESNCTSVFKSYCTTRAFLPSCDSQTATRIQACSGSIANLRRAGGEATDCINYADRICGRGQLGGSNPFAPICADSSVSNYAATITTVQNLYCANDVFNPLCDGYIDQRVAACHLNGVPTNADPRCPAIIAQQCPSSGGARRSTCHNVVTPLREARITAPITNYVEATADELELGFDQSQGNALPNISDFTAGTIQLSDLAAVTSPDGDNDGVGFATFTDSTFFTLEELGMIARIGYVGTEKIGDTTTTISRTQDGTTRTEIITVNNSVRRIKSRTVTLGGNTEYRTISETLDGNTEYFNVVFEPTQRFYAGVLDGDTLGSPLSENLKNAKWPAKLAIYNEVNLLCLGNENGDRNTQGGNPHCGAAGYDGRLVEPAEFTLLVSFDGSSGTIKADGIPVIGDYEFAIDAGFNLQGKIFGNTRLSVVRRSALGLFPVTLLTEASDGTITGKIGTKGLLAAFVSDGVNNRLGEYAGGLVAHNPHNGVTAPDCTVAGTPFHGRCADNDDLRIMLCSTRHATAMADFDGNCTDDNDVTDAICAASGTHANPFDGVICADPQPLVQQAFLANCDNRDMSLRAATCTAVTACITNPFSSTCNTGATAEVYASARVRHLEYCRSSVAVAGTDNCLLAVTYCASASDTNCTGLPTSYCIGEAGRSITGDTSSCGARVSTRCATNPLSPLCADDTINTGFTNADNLKISRENFCGRTINANNPDCALTIAGFCDDASDTAIFHTLCSNRVHFRRNVIARACDDEDRDTALDNLCNNPHAYDIQRLEHCKTVDFKRAGCGVTISAERQAMLEITCGDNDGLRGTNPNDPICTAHNRSDHYTNLNICGADDRAGTNPASPICEIESQALITVAALCGQGFETEGTIGTIGINPFSAICADNLFNPIPCPTCADDTERTTNSNAARLEAQRNFCRQDNTRMACTQTIADFCPATPSADLFDDLCNGDAYLANRVLHCNTGFTHAKCAADQMNISEAAAVCGTTSIPGTDPFNAICKSETLNPIACPSCEAISDAKDKAKELARIRIIVLRATQQTFCRATANVSESICADTISRFCSVPTDSDVIFDDLCVGANYTGARLAYCIHPTRSEHAECETDADNKSALITLCGNAETTGTNPFSVACTTAFSLRLEIDALCGGGRNSQIPLCMDENAIPAIDRESVTASQENFCRGNLANTACEETIADFCDFAIGTNVLDPLCGGNEYYQEIRLITCLNPDVSHVECRGTAGIVATLCPTDGDGTNRHESCPIIVDHALYRTPVNEFDENGGGFVGAHNFDALEAVGVIDKTKIFDVYHPTRNPNPIPDSIEAALAFAQDAPANLITGTTAGLEFGTIIPDGAASTPGNPRTTIRNGGDPTEVAVAVASNTAYQIGDGNNSGYALAVATVSTAFDSERKLYAGLLSNTESDVGAPNFDNPSVGIWNANMNLIMNGGDATVTDATFDLVVDFNAQTIRTHATRLAQFGIVGADFAEPQFTASDSPVVALYNSRTGRPYYQRDSRGEDIIVAPRDTYTDCDGNVLAQGSRIPLCEGGGLPDYNSYRSGDSEVLTLDQYGRAFILTQPKSTTARLTIDASFSRLGFIHGATNIETGFLNDNGNFIGKRGGKTVNSAGKLVGWIGDGKLVGAFASNAGSAEAYAGGFTATPSATPSPTNFISGGTGDLTLTGKTDAVAATEQAPHPLGITSNAAYYLTGSTTSGFALASENIANGEVNLYAGILTGTNLGNPLFDNGATGTWNAKLNLIMLGGTAAANFDLKVDFNARTIETYANRPAEFTLVDADFYAAKRSASNSPLVTLLHPTEMEGGSPAPFYSEDTSGTDVLVQAGETITDCAGMPIAVGGKIPLCGGGGNIAYITDNQGRVVLDADGKPTFETVSASGRLTVNGRFSSIGKISGSTNIQVGQITQSGDLIGTDKKVIDRIGDGDPSVALAGGSGVLTGLIGEDGLVAAFISDGHSPDAYAGGFTATAGPCRIGGTPFDKTNCPDTNIAAKALRLQLCIDRDPVALPLATNCAGDSTITTVVCNNNGAYANPFDADICPTLNDDFKSIFVNSCLANPDHANACTTGQVARCLHDPYAFDCKSDIYIAARTDHLETCAIATAPPDPRCVNLQVQLNNCAVASPAQSCGTLVNDYCLGGAGRVIAGKTTCVDNIRVACTANVLHPRCRDAGVFTTTTQNDAYGAHIAKQRMACAGAIDSLPVGATVSDCDRLGITFDLCSNDVRDAYANPFAPICSDPQGNPSFERIEATQVVFCEKLTIYSRSHEACPALLKRHAGLLGKTEHWRFNAIRQVAVPELNADGSIKTTNFLDAQGNPVPITVTINGVEQTVFQQDPVTKIIQVPINITPANKIRRDNAPVNYIVGGTTQLDLAGLPVPRNPDGTKPVDSAGVVIDHNPLPNNGIANRGGLTLSDFDGNDDAASGFAFASATFAKRTYRVAFGDSTPPIDDKFITTGGEFRTRTVGGTKLYTGLLSGTNVGAPVTDIQINAEWSGKFDMIYGRGFATRFSGISLNSSVTNYATQDFTLLVSFDGDDGIITNKAPIQLASNVTFDINGRFTDKGVIYGKTRLLNYSNPVATGSLTGLIGARGAVAAFISDDRNPLSPGNGDYVVNFGNYVGGFVAMNAVNYSDWARSQAGLTNTADTVSPRNQFLGTAASATALTETGAGTVTIRGSVTLADDADSGVAFFTNGTATHSPNSQYYAGLLAGTNLGAPINDASQVGAWTGTFKSVGGYLVSGNTGSFVNATVDQDFTLTVTFNSVSNGGTIAAYVPLPAENNNSGNFRHYRIDGAFNDSGVITGTVNLGSFAGGVRTTPNDSRPNNGVLTGLIGQNGAVGAFHNTLPADMPNMRDQYRYSGGFVAAPSQ